MAVGTVIITGTIKMLSLSVQSSQVVRSSLSEQELRAAVNNIIANDLSCKSNLKPKGGSPSTGHLTESTANEGIGSLSTLSFYSVDSGVTTSRILIDQSTPFKGQLDIVQMSLTRTGDDDPKGSSPVDRTFVVHYKKKGLGQLNTVGGGVCSTSDTSGCYYVSCDLRYQLENKANPEVTSCSAQNCVAYASVAAGAPDCYKVDPDDKQRVLVGCGTTQDNIGKGIVALGFNAGRGGGGEHSIFIGRGAGKEGKHTVCIGKQSCANNTADYNVFIGRFAGYSNTTAYKNIFIGNEAGNKNTTALYNTFIGNQAGRSNTTGYANTFIGNTAGYSNTEDTNDPDITTDDWPPEASMNTFIGHQTGYHNTTGWGNTFVGSGTGDKNITGSRNTFLGTGANRTQTAGDDNVYIGYASGYEATGSQNVFVGSWTGRDSDRTRPLSSGDDNVFIGYQSGHNNETGFSNTFVGRSAGLNNSTGDAQVFVGTEAGSHNTTGDSNTFIGRGAGRDNQTGSNNTYVGEFAAYPIRAGNWNTVIGNYAANIPSGTVNHSIYIRAGDTSNSNKIQKTNASRKIITQNSLPPGNNNIMIGSYSLKKAKEITSQHSNYLWIQDLIEGNSQEKWVAVNNQVETKNLYASLHTSSDKRLKTNLTPLDGALEKINQLKSYSFNWKDEADAVIPPTPPTPPPSREGGLKEAARGGGDTVPLGQGGIMDEARSVEKSRGEMPAAARRHFGFIAQEALEVLPEVVEKNRKGFFTIRYTEIIPLLVSAFKEFQNKILTAVKDLKNIVNGHVRSIAKLIETDKELIKQTISLKQENKKLKTFLQKQNQEILELKKRIELLESPPPK